MHCSGDAAANDVLAQSQPQWEQEGPGIHCPPVVADLHYRIQMSATGDKPPYPMSRTDSSRCCFTARGDWAILTTTFHDMLAQLQPDCGGLLNVKALCLPLCLYFWLNHQITVCLPFPGYCFCRVRLARCLVFPCCRFVNFCLVHLETNIRECIVK